MFGFMHEFWTIPMANMMCTRSQNYTNKVVGKHGLQTFEFVFIVLLIFLSLFDGFVPISAHQWLFLDKSFVQIYSCPLNTQGPT